MLEEVTADRRRRAPILKAPKPEGTHLAGWARLCRAQSRASPSLFRLSKHFSFEVIWNKKKESLSKALKEIPLCHFVRDREEGNKLQHLLPL